MFNQGNEILVPVVVNYQSHGDDQLFVIKSTDKGKTFSVVSKIDAPTISNTVVLQDGFVSDQLGWITAGDSYFRFDGTSIHPPLGVPVADDNTDVSFVNERTGYLVNGGTLYQTTDGGTSWRSMETREAK